MTAVTPLAIQVALTTAGTYDFSENAVLLGSATMLFANAVNVIGVRFLGRTNQVGAAVEVATIVVAVVALLAHARHGPRVAAYRDSAGTGTELARVMLEVGRLDDADLPLPR